MTDGKPLGSANPAWMRKVSIGLVFLVATLTACSPTMERLRVAKAAAEYISEHPGGAYRTYYIPASGMHPTLPVGATVLVDLNAYAHSLPQRGDIVTFTAPIPAPAPFLKRVIAVPGDRLRMERGALYVNGIKLREPYIENPAKYNLAVRNYSIAVDTGTGYQTLDREMANIPPRAQWSSPDRLPTGCYFVRAIGKFSSGPLAGRTARISGKVVQML